ncbi:hypothetical protein CKY02_06565 [Photorhabdus bodei]|uniref:Uncharacterized protein n=1 Tax=Photorhabdus bodei TaxID=2029681 RepID=A0A329X9H1_9GAMM|nr:hypothetical protein CKY02_06565 [Photorhabdus bodei]
MGESHDYAFLSEEEMLLWGYLNVNKCYVIVMKFKYFVQHAVISVVTMGGIKKLYFFEKKS